LVFSDMTRGGVFALRLAGGQPEQLIPHRKGVGGLVAHAGGGFVIAGRNVAHKRPGSEQAATTVLLEPAADERFFNDLTADGRGRIFVGSVAINPLAPEETRAGRLYCLGLDGNVEVLADDVLVSNGLGSDPADEVLYHVDSDRRVVWAYRIAGGPIGETREVFVDTSGYPGRPDGLAVARDGSVWVAMAGGGRVVGWDAKGAAVDEIPVPQDLVTSVCFGGDDYRTLFVLTGTNDEFPDRDGGCVYECEGLGPGMAGTLARVPLRLAG
jgi:sugar lactone lactonase YvrE